MANYNQLLITLLVIFLHLLWEFVTIPAVKDAVDPEAQKSDLLTIATGLALLQCWWLARAVDLEDGIGDWKRIFRMRDEVGDDIQDEQQQSEECCTCEVDVEATPSLDIVESPPTKEYEVAPTRWSTRSQAEDTPQVSVVTVPEYTLNDTLRTLLRPQERRIHPKAENIPPPIPPKSPRRRSKLRPLYLVSQLSPKASNDDVNTESEAPKQSIDYSAKSWNCLFCKAENFPHSICCCSCRAKQPQKKRLNLDRLRSLDWNTRNSNASHRPTDRQRNQAEPTPPQPEAAVSPPKSPVLEYLAAQPWERPFCEAVNLAYSKHCIGCHAECPQRKRLNLDRQSNQAKPTPQQPVAVIDFPPVLCTPRDKGKQKAVVPPPQSPVLGFSAQPWECTRCEALNFPQYVFCSQCGLDKDEKRRELDKEHQAGPPAPPPETAFPGDLKEEKQAGASGSPPRSDKDFTDMEIWGCRECNGGNFPNAKKCGHCGSQKPNEIRPKQNMNTTGTIEPANTTDISNDGATFGRSNISEPLQALSGSHSSVADYLPQRYDEYEAEYPLLEPQQRIPGTWWCQLCGSLSSVFNPYCKFCGQIKPVCVAFNNPFEGFDEVSLWVCSQCEKINSTDNIHCGACWALLPEEVSPPKTSSGSDSPMNDVMPLRVTNYALEEELPVPGIGSDSDYYDSGAAGLLQTPFHGPDPKLPTPRHATNSGSNSDEVSTNTAGSLQAPPHRTKSLGSNSDPYDIPMNRSRPPQTPFQDPERELPVPSPESSSNSGSDSIPITRARPLQTPLQGRDRERRGTSVELNCDSDDIPMIHAPPLMDVLRPSPEPPPIRTSFGFSLERIPLSTTPWLCPPCASANFSILLNCAHCSHPNVSLPSMLSEDLDSSWYDDEDATLVFQQLLLPVAGNNAVLEPFCLEGIDMYDVNPWWCGGCSNWNMAPVRTCASCGEVKR
ncbi:hypothetical protein BDD12DRAFT_886173 [Trichophaea hybrida]|nr:hypothetical protein BDD12DRAFT_886173 [Trichophaea hybrida]